MIERPCQEGGDRSGDEEEASREEGCPEEKEVTYATSGYAGGGTPQRDSYFILYEWISSRETIIKKYHFTCILITP